MRKKSKLTVSLLIFAVVVMAAAGVYLYVINRKPAEPVRLSAPVNLSIDEESKFLTWDETANAGGYTVDIDGSAFAAETNCYSLALLTEYKTYMLKVKALGDGTNYTDSDWSETKSYTLSVPEKTEYTVSFDSNGGGDLNPQTVEAGQSVGDPGDPFKNGYTFDGWFENGNFGGNAVIFPYIPTANITLYAKYSVVSYTVSYTLNDGVNHADNPAVYTVESPEIILKAPEREGYTFTGWTEGGVIPAGSCGDKTFTANWIAAYKVTYDYQDAPVGDAEQFVTYGLNYALTVPVYPGYRFDGWYQTVGGLGVRYTGPDGVGLAPWTETADKTLYAYWLGTEGLEYTSVGGTEYSAALGTANPAGAIYIQKYYNGLPVTGIAYTAFQYATELTSVTLPSSIKDIGAEAFAESGIIDIFVPASVESIGFKAFSTCYKLTDVIFGENSLLTYIGENAFEYCEKLTGIVIPQSVTIIERNTFYNCSDLSSVVFPPSLISIGAYAFQGCVNLPSVVFPSLLSYIGDYAFKDCSALESFEIPDTVTNLGIEAFHETAWYNRQQNNGVVYLNDILYGYKGYMGPYSDISIAEGTRMIANDAFSDQSNLRNVTLPSTLISIGAYAFSNLNGIQSSIFIPASVTSIGYSAFARSNFRGVEFEDGIRLTDIGSGLFSNCRYLSEIKIPSSLTHLPIAMFWGCERLKTIWIPSSVTVMEAYSLADCPFADIYYSGTQEQWNAIEKSDAGISGGTVHYNAIF